MKTRRRARVSRKAWVRITVGGEYLEHDQNGRAPVFRRKVDALKARIYVGDVVVRCTVTYVAPWARKARRK